MNLNCENIQKKKISSMDSVTISSLNEKPICLGETFDSGEDVTV